MNICPKLIVTNCHVTLFDVFSFPPKNLPFWWFDTHFFAPPFKKFSSVHQKFFIGNAPLQSPV